MNGKSKQHLIDVFIGIVLFVCFAALVYYVQVNETAVINSDNAFPILAGQAMFNGNPLLEGWVASTRSYYFDSFIYGVFGQAFGYDFRLIYKVSALAIALLFASICYAVLRLSAESSKAQKARNTLFAIALCLGSIYAASDSTQNNWAASHVFAAIVGFALIWNLNYAVTKKKMLSIGYVLALLLVCVAMGDYLLLYFAILPAGLVLIQRMFSRTCDKDEKRSSFLQLVLLVVAVVVNRSLIFALEAAGGMPPAFDTGTVAFVRAEDIPGRVVYALECVLTVFNGGFFGKAVTVDQATYYLVGCAICALLVLLFVSMRKTSKTFLDKVLLLSIGLTVLVLCFTSFAHANDALWDTRLMYYLFFALVILFVRIDWKRVSSRLCIPEGHRFELLVSISLTVLFVGCGLSKMHHTDVKTYEDSKFFAVANEVEKLGLTQGYASFWLSDVITLATDRNVEVVGISGPDPQVFRWLAAPLDSVDDANFVLVDESGWGGLSREKIIETVGTPKEERFVDNVTIMVYDKNIMPYIKGSGVDGVRLKAWWSIPEGEAAQDIKVTSAHFESAFAADDDGDFESSGSGYLLFGPYEALTAGTYEITFNLTYEGAEEAGSELGFVDLYSYSKNHTYAQAPIRVGSEEVFSVTLKDVVVPQNVGDIETRVYADGPGLGICGITMERTS